MKFLLDNLWIPPFLIAYFMGGIYVATVALIVSLFLIVAIYWFKEKRLHKLHLTTALIVAALGGLTLYLHDPAFIKLKPTLVYGLFACALLGSHWIGDRVLMARIPQTVIALPDPLWRKVNLAWACFALLCAGLNLYIADNFDEATWVKFKVFGFSALLFVFLLSHIPFLHKYLPQDAANDAR